MITQTRAWYPPIQQGGSISDENVQGIDTPIRKTNLLLYSDVEYVDEEGRVDMQRLALGWRAWWVTVNVGQVSITTDRCVWNAKLTYIQIFVPIFKYLNLGTNNWT